MAGDGGLPDLVSHVRFDTTGVSVGVAKTKAELGGLGGATKGLENDFKGLLSSITGIGSGTSQLSGVFSKFTGSVGQAKSAMGGVASEGSKLNSVLTGVGAGAAGVGLALGALAVEGIAKFTAAAAEVRKLQATLGSSAEDASKLRNVAVGLGVDVDKMGSAFFKLGPILAANKGDLAGVHVEIAKNADGGTDMVKTIDNVRAAYQSIHDPIQKTQFLLEAAKKSGLDLRPILAADAELWRKLGDSGPKFNDKDLKAAKDLGLAQRELGQSVDSAEIALAKGLVPALTQFTTAATNGVDGLHRFGEGLAHIKIEGGPAAVAVSGLEKAFGFVAKNATPLGTVLDVLNGGHKKTAGSAAAQAEAEEKLTESLQQAAKEAAAASAALDKLATAQERNADAADTLEHSQAALAKITAENAKAHQDAEKSVQEFGRASEETDAAINKAVESDAALSDAAKRVAKDTRDKAVAEADAAEVTVSAQVKVDLYKEALLRQADALGGPVGEQLRAYAGTIKSIPDEKPTYLHLPGADGVLNTLDDIYQRIDGIPTRKDVYVVVHNSDTGREEGTDRTGNQVATGGRLGVNSVIPMASGGRTAGFVTRRPTFLVGEGNPAFPEAVIATDPQYKVRNIELWKWAGRKLNMLAQGGLAAGAWIRPNADSAGQSYDALATSGPTPTSRAQFIANDQNDPNSGRPGYVQDVDGHWYGHSLQSDVSAGQSYDALATSGATPTSRAQFLANDHADPNAGRYGYVQEVDGSWRPAGTGNQTRILASVPSMRGNQTGILASAPSLRSGGIGSHQSYGSSSGGEIDYDRLGGAVAQAIIAADISVDVDGATLGRVVSREFASIARARS
jgi:hypothetical protein